MVECSCCSFVVQLGLLLAVLHRWATAMALELEARDVLGGAGKMAAERGAAYESLEAAVKEGVSGEEAELAQECIRPLLVNVLCAPAALKEGTEVGA
eukprot:COSAG05_NODE_19516_length_291_cov_1.067708_1_plen_96_part_11